MKKIILYTLFIFCCHNAICGEANRIILTSKVPSDTIKTVKWYVDAGISGINYSGDLSRYEKWGSMFHIAIQNNKKKILKPRLEAFYGLFSGQNSLYNFDGGTPNKFFQTQLFGLTAHAQLHLYRTDIFSLYFSQGLGLAALNIYDQNGTDFVNLPRTRALGENYNNTTLLLPTAIGGTVFFQNRCGLNLEISSLNTMTDYLDNIGKWGTDTGNDNLIRIKFSFFAPILWQKTVKK